MENSILGELIDKHIFLKDHFFERYDETKKLRIAATALKNSRDFSIANINHEGVNYFQILYDEEKARDAIALAKDFRRKAKNTELIKKAKDRLLEEYVEYGKEYYAGSLIYIKKSGEITMINLMTGEHKIVNSTDRS